MRILTVLSNILWVILGDIWLAMAWAIIGIVLCITIVGIPFGIQCFKIMKLTFFPFGARIKSTSK